ncbi:MAG: hypothetical protein JNL01_00125 [Bdellovibrionales bacterium]|nr:hypothetical protein [Bdellovibrionales bacterium]
MGPGLSEKALAEKTVQSILNQTDPIGTEVIAAGLPSVGLYLREAFSEDIRLGRLVIVPVEGSASLWPTAALLHVALQRSRGSWITWTELGDFWGPQRLQPFVDRLRRHEIWVGVGPGRADTVQQRPRVLWEDAHLIPGSVWIKKEFLEALGSFPSGASQLLHMEYDLVLRAVERLQKDQSEQRFGVYEEDALFRQISPLSKPVPLHLASESPIDRLRKEVTRIARLPKLPFKDWLPMLSRITKRR